MDIAIAIAASMGKMISSVLDLSMPGQEFSVDGSGSVVRAPIQDEVDVLMVEYPVEDTAALTRFFLQVAETDAI